MRLPLLRQVLIVMPKDPRGLQAGPLLVRETASREAKDLQGEVVANLHQEAAEVTGRPEVIDLENHHLIKPRTGIADRPNEVNHQNFQQPNLLEALVNPPKRSDAHVQPLLLVLSQFRAKIREPLERQEGKVSEMKGVTGREKRLARTVKQETKSAVLQTEVQLSR